MSVGDAVTAPRIHHQWVPDEVFVEPGIADSTLDALRALGHKITQRPPMTSANSIAVTPEGFIGAADRRTRGTLAVGY
jgi:gamma-glutamyltranspeptidase/glutathione hydrolase